MVVNIGVNVNKAVNIGVNNNNKGEIKMVNIYEDGKIIGRVNSNRNLDFWDGNNFTHGGVGRHLGLTIRRNGDLVFIYTSQWQGDRDWAEVVTEDEAMQAILRADAIDLLENPRFKKLKSLYEAQYAEADEAEDIEVNSNEEEMKMVNSNNNEVNIGKVPYTRVGKIKERKMKNNNNSVVELDEVVNNEVNNNSNEGEIEMGVNNEWIERIEVYLNVKNGRTLTSLINDGTLADGSWQRLGFGPDENLEDVYVGDGWVVSIDRVNNLEIIGNPDIKYGTRVYVMEHGNIIEKALYLSVDEDGTVGQEDVVYEMRSEEEVVEAAVNKAGSYIREWMSYFTVDVSDIDFNELIKFYKNFASGKNSYETVYHSAVEWLMHQIKNQRELEAHQDEDRVYEEDWGFEHLEDWDIEEVKVADDLRVDHPYYGTLYLSVDWHERYKELDDAYGVLEEFKMDPFKYADEWYSTDDWREALDYRVEDIYKEFMSEYGNDVPYVLLADWLERGSYTEEITKIIRRLVARSMSVGFDDYSYYPKYITETESDIYLSLLFGGYRETIKVDSVNYTYQDELRVVAELSDTISGYYETEMVDGYEQRVVKNKQ